MPTYARLLDRDSIQHINHWSCSIHPKLVLKSLTKNHYESLWFVSKEDTCIFTVSTFPSIKSQLCILFIFAVSLASLTACATDSIPTHDCTC